MMGFARMRLVASLSPYQSTSQYGLLTATHGTVVYCRAWEYCDGFNNLGLERITIPKVTTDGNPINTVDHDIPKNFLFSSQTFSKLVKTISTGESGPSH
jgi:hypothetical protein